MTKSHQDRWPGICIVGPYPPPFGGISVHLKRFADHLRIKGIDFRLYNTQSQGEDPPEVVNIQGNRKLWFLKFCFTHQHSVIHLHTENWLSRLVFAIAASFRPGIYIMSVHGGSLTDAASGANPIKRALTRWIAQRMDHIVAVNPYIEKGCLESLGVQPERVRVIPAFIPPNPEKAPPLPAEIEEFAKTHKPLLFGVGWVGVVYNGVDLYGIDMMIKLVLDQKDNNPDMGLIIAVNGGDENEFQEIIERTARIAEGRILIIRAVEDVSPIMLMSDIFLRPSNTDGDSVAVREALFLGVPVVASDAVPRPEGCVLFETRKQQSFEAAVRDSLNQIARLRQKVSALDLAQNVKPMIDLYRKVLS